MERRLASILAAAAEITCFYLNEGIGTLKPMTANVVIPTVVCRTILISAIVAHIMFRETLTPVHFADISCIILGVLLLYLDKGSAMG